MDAEHLALVWYVADAHNTFRGYNRSVILSLAEDISNLSAHIPIFYRSEAYKPGEIKRVAGQLSLKGFTPHENNTLDISVNGEVVKRNVSPLYLMALMSWALNHLSNRGLENQPGFEYVKEGMKIVEYDIA